MIEFRKDNRTCPNCKTKLLVECEDQATGFRQMSYLTCPKCNKEIERSMSIDYLGIEVEK